MNFWEQDELRMKQTFLMQWPNVIARSSLL